jgi:hypothetical protein
MLPDCWKLPWVPSNLGAQQLGCPATWVPSNLGAQQLEAQQLEAQQLEAQQLDGGSMSAAVEIRLIPARLSGRFPP